MRCRLCGSHRLRSILDLGATPPCERFLAVDALDDPEPTYPLHLRLCEDCLLLQIPALITPEDTFTEYAYFSSYSDSWVEHARQFVEEARDRYALGDDAFVVEVASNDGYLLQHVVGNHIRCLGIEPSVNVGAAAREKGVPTLTAFLDEGLAERVRHEHGAADLVVANNVYAHIPDLLGFTKSLRTLLADDGRLSIEVHHALNLVQLGQFDTIYHEHFQYYTLLSASRALATAGLTVVDAELIPTHGGSIRVWAAPDETAGEPSERVAEVLAAEAAAGLHEVDGYLDMQAGADRARQELLRFLLEKKAEGARVVGYGAPGKGNTLLNYSGIRTDLMEYTVDRNPYKHGRYTPGTRIPIHPPERIDEDKPDVIVVLPWNLETEISKQLEYVADWGGQIVYPLPELHFANRDTEGDLS
ncbi:class I SAM-dependent methyltransferase [Gordonia rhizosphera]|uniref:Putative methyltransferase n=1 Tax=Gordonia rhizosphera NBRC 16068 TaxID=1108045 RepID=K6WMQ6_9ACTN|nr:class I SAM-dependent methyltransferase [Gordonia rhizosphera]GAB93412.1 putative methyltransferase [Gordonia rhizosphera NBRC 16068]